MLTVFLATVLLASPAQSGANNTPVQGALTTLRQVCQPALEGQVAPRDLAEAAGMLREDSPPDSVVRQFPMTRLGSAAYSAPVEGGKVYVISTFLPPPATPFSCLVALDVDAPGLAEAVEDMLIKEGGRYSVQDSMPDPMNRLEQIVLKSQGSEGSTVDTIMAVRPREADANTIRAGILSWRLEGSAAANNAPRQ